MPDSGLDLPARVWTCGIAVKRQGFEGDTALDVLERTELLAQHTAPDHLHLLLRTALARP